jgi:hypothetical protein
MEYMGESGEPCGTPMGFQTHYPTRLLCFKVVKKKANPTSPFVILFVLRDHINIRKDNRID